MRRNRLSALIPLAVVLTSGAGASAAILTTGLIEQGGSVSGIACAAVNVGKKPLDVLIEVIDGGGGVAYSTTLSLGPNGGNGLTSNADSGLHSCRFSFPGSAKRVRGSIHARDVTGAVVAIDAAR